MSSASLLRELVAELATELSRSQSLLSELSRAQTLSLSELSRAQALTLSELRQRGGIELWSTLLLTELSTLKLAGIELWSGLLLTELGGLLTELSGLKLTSVELWLGLVVLRESGRLWSLMLRVGGSSSGVWISGSLWGSWSNVVAGLSELLTSALNESWVLSGLLGGLQQRWIIVVVVGLSWLLLVLSWRLSGVLLLGGSGMSGMSCSVSGGLSSSGSWDSGAVQAEGLSLE